VMRIKAGRNILAAVAELSFVTILFAHSQTSSVKESLAQLKAEFDQKFERIFGEQLQRTFREKITKVHSWGATLFVSVF